MQLIVLGMHRSGTSGVTRLLNLSGAWFGNDEIATEPNEENPKGFWERRDVRAVCDGLLRGAGFDWWKIADFSIDRIPQDVLAEQRDAFAKILDELESHRPWVVKEPRLCLLLPVLLPLLEDPVCIHVTREPLEVAQSMHARGDMPVQTGLALWEAYSLAAYRSSHGLARVHLRHEDVVEDPVEATRGLLEDLADLGVTGLELPDPETIRDFITPSLHRQRRDPSLRGLRLSQAQAQLARAVDDRTILEWDRFPPLSEGSVEQLQMLEADRLKLEADRLKDEQTTAELQDLTVRLRRATEENQWWKDRLQRLSATADEGFERTRERLRTIEGTRTWKLANGLQDLRTSLTPGARVPAADLIERALEEVERGRREVRIKSAVRPHSHATRPGERVREITHLEHPPEVRSSGPRRDRSDRPRVAVVAWDVCHNPIGRANVLAEVLDRHFDVEIWGARFDRYGTDVWAPLRDGTVPVKHFAGLTFPGHLAQMEAIAAQIDADAIWVSKPRLPSFLLGALAKEHRNRPLILDVDDHELAFFDEDEGLDLQLIRQAPPELDLSLPFERAWTRACDPLIGSADALTVSNPALQDRYGGTIVPHARDENVFDPARYDREATRAELGIAPDTRLLLFGGTPRIHKGVVDVLAALDAIGDDRYRLLVFGTRELDDLGSQIGDLDRWAISVPYQPFRDLARIVGAADLSCVLQDPTHPVARYQMPAKISDALAMGVPCLVTPVPPLADLIAQKVVRPVRPGEDLAQAITDVFDRPDEASAQAARGRQHFLDHLSYRSVADQITPLFQGLIADPPAMKPSLERLIDVPRELFARDATEAANAANAPPTIPHRKPGSGKRRITPDQPFDVAMFWKQNDTGIYGRRQEMFLAELERCDRVATIVHFDNPVSPEFLAATLRRSGTERADQGRLVVRNTVERLMHRNDTERTHHHTFVHAGRRSRLVGLPPRGDYIDHVRSVLSSRGIGSRPLVLWAYPSNPDLPELIDAIDPDVVVSDVVDDNRTWHTPGSPNHDRITQNYAEVLERSDLVIANCEPVATSMRSFVDRIHVVPNGCEPPRSGPPPPRPRELRRLHGPVIGYVGNLSSRIDLPLLDSLARRRPDWNLVLIGSAHLDDSALRLEALPNVHFLGVKPHTVARDYIAHFDVGLIPHVDDDMTRSMNPLKAYVYCAAGIPVVSTPVANLDDLAGMIRVAHGPDEFEASIEAALAAERVPVDPALIEPLTWRRRLTQVLELIDRL